jgi:hypothetical protein
MDCLRKLLALVLSATIASGCASLPFTSQRADETIALEPAVELPEDARLDLEILIFDPGLPESDDDLPEDVSPGIRKAEAHYLACLLRNTLQRTEQWGDVFMGPRESGAVEAFLLAEIVKSDGTQLVLKVEAWDATERVWLEERYRTETTAEDYANDDDPYQRMFNTIANDLVEARSDLTPDELRSIRTVAELQFAARFAPESFEGYVERGDGDVLEVVRLPAHDDPMVGRVMQARDRESMFIDSLNGHYEALCADMTGSYLQWRDASRNEVAQYRAARNKKIATWVAIPLVIAATVLGAIAAGDSGGNAVVAIGGVATYELYKKAGEYSAEADLHKGTLEEMNASFDSEVEPMVVEVEGETHRLTGSIDEQYAEWQQLLAELYAAETGLLADVSAHIDHSPEEDAVPEPSTPPPNSPPPAAIP